MEKTQEVVWDSLLDCGGLEWQRTLHDLKKLQWLVMKMFLKNLTWFDVSKVLFLLVAIKRLP